MNLTVIVPPPFEPVTLAEVYAQLRLDPDITSSPAEISHPDDMMLRSQIQAAREFVEVATRRALVTQTFRLSVGVKPNFFGWRSAGGCLSERIFLRRPPLQRVIQVSYFDTDNALQTVDPFDYYVTDDQVPELRFVAGAPTFSMFNRPDALRVEYVAGYAPAGSPPTTQEEFTASVPETLKQAVLIGVQLAYDNLSPEDRSAMENMREVMCQSKRIQLT